MPENPTPEPPVVNKKEIKISTSVSSITKATDTGFDSNDRIGLYVVNRKGDTPLLSTGNHVDNMRFTYSGTWTPDTPIYCVVTKGDHRRHLANSPRQPLLS